MLTFRFYIKCYEYVYTSLIVSKIINIINFNFCNIFNIISEMM